MPWRGSAEDPGSEVVTTSTGSYSDRSAAADGGEDGIVAVCQAREVGSRQVKSARYVLICLSLGCIFVGSRIQRYDRYSNTAEMRVTYFAGKSNNLAPPITITN